MGFERVDQVLVLVNHFVLLSELAGSGISDLTAQYQVLQQAGDRRVGRFVYQTVASDPELEHQLFYDVHVDDVFVVDAVECFADVGTQGVTVPTFRTIQTAGRQWQLSRQSVSHHQAGYFGTVTERNVTEIQ